VTRSPLASAAPTRTAPKATPLAQAGRLVSPGDLIESPRTRLRYRVERFIGQGGFGQAYLARRLGRSSSIPAQVCIKLSGSIDEWVREAYFGQVLEGHSRAIQVYEAFPLPPRGGLLLYGLVLEYASEGDLRACLGRSDHAWTEAVVRREIAGILQVLGKLHRGQVLHRDLTPMNVFVCAPRRLKLGDFGLVRQQSTRRGTAADALNPAMAPSDIVAGEAPKWQTRDDVYQVGQLLAMLVKGDARARIRSGEIRHLACSDPLKEIIHRCVGERRKRYQTADELIEALRARAPSLRTRAVSSLKGVHLSFTGILSRPRKEAVEAARRVGAVVHSGPSARTTVVVRGRPNPLQAAGRDAGLKLMEIKRLRAKGHRIALLSEDRFWRLVAKRRR